MKKNSGLTVITLIITIIVIVMIASITIYSGLDAVETIRYRDAKDSVNAIYLALIANESIIPSGLGDSSSVADNVSISDRHLTDRDFELMGLDYKEEECNVVFNKWLSGENNFVYTFSYTNSLGKSFSGFEYSRYEEISRINRKPEFDVEKGVNRPVLFEQEMIPLNYSGLEVKNVYMENWYNYEKGISNFAEMSYNGEKYVWIPRFAYRIQDFYAGKKYKGIPSTAIDIVFLRESSNYMANNEVLPAEYLVHPAFANGEVGFWLMIDSKEANSLDAAVSNARIEYAGVDIEESHLMKNSEYAALVYLMRVLENSQVVFNGREYVAAVCDETRTDFDSYYSSYFNINNIENVRGHAMNDTPWDLKAIPVVPNESLQFMIRDVNSGGLFFYDASDGTEQARYRIAISSR